MKKIIFAVLIAASINSTAQDATVIDMKITNTMGANGSFEIYVSELGVRSKMKMQMPAGAPMASINIDALSKSNEPNKTYIISEEKKSYSITQKNSEQKQSTDNVTVEKVGEETVNGYKCIHAKVKTNGKQTSDFWNSKEVFTDYGKYSHMFESANKNGNGAEQKALKDAGCDGFPVKMVSTSSTEGTTTMELKKVKKKAIEKSIFEIPTDYKQSSVANTLMGSDMNMDMDKIMKMTPAEREAWQKEMIQKMGGQR